MKSVDENNFFDDWPKNSVIAEVGVLYGDNANFMRSIIQPREFWLIDSWEGTEDIYQHVLKYQVDPATHILRGDSADSAAQFADHYFDGVYIDACHTPIEAVLRDLEAYYPKVKVGGKLSGHDYNYEAHLCVIQALEVFCKKYNIEITKLSNRGWIRWEIQL